MKITQYPYLKDSNLLAEIDNLKIKKQWARIVLLDWEEKPIQEIQAYIINGNLNLTGDSAIRRTGNLTVYIDDEKNGKITNVDNLFSINKKIYLEIGYENPDYMKEEIRPSLNPLRGETKAIIDYGPYISPINKYSIFWFPQGIFVVNSASSTHSSGGINLSLSLKDKMCLLNGDCGGVITSSVQFDQYDTMDENGEWILTRPTIYQIILELVNHFGEEDMSRIIIENVDTRVKQCMKWIGDTPLYMYGAESERRVTTNFDEIPIGIDPQVYNYGDDVGFIYTDFTYPGELVAKPGDTVVSILDKIKNTLGNFEYFYDVEGNFRFREIKNYLNTTQPTNILNNLTNESYYVFDLSKGKAEYDFTNSPLIISYSNSPQYSKIKNDYVVWGTRKNTDGLNIPIRYHLAIDKKPQIGNTYEVYLYEDEEDGLIKAKKPLQFIDKNHFPEIGAQGVFYEDLSTGMIYKWEGLDEAYVPFNDFPSTFQKVEYIENNASNYIDIDYIPSVNTRIYIEAAQITNNNDLQTLFGSVLPITNYYTVRYLPGSSAVYQTVRFETYNNLLNFLNTAPEMREISIYMSDNADEVDAFDSTINNNNDNININIGDVTGATGKKVSLGTKFTIEINLQEQTPNVQVNQETIPKYNNVDYSSSENNISLSLFALHEGSGYKNFFLGRIYNCQIWDKDESNNPVLVRNLAPCYNKQSNQIGLYDTVEKHFYASEGTGTMTKGEDIETDLLFASITTNDWRTELYLQGVVTEPYGLKSNYYFAELEAEWPKIFDLENNCYQPGVLEHPEDLDYWLDFIDSEADISKISVGTIGRRPQAKQMNEINCVFEPEVPDLIFVETGQSDTNTKRQECIDRQQYYTQVEPELYNNLATGGTSNSAYNEVRNLLYQGSSYNESIQLSTIPIYYLEPNIRITAFDADSDIHGDYIIKSISLPLDINGTSSISATRALNQF